MRLFFFLVCFCASGAPWGRNAVIEYPIFAAFRNHFSAAENGQTTETVYRLRVPFLGSRGIRIVRVVNKRQYFGVILRIELIFCSG